MQDGINVQAGIFSKVNKRVARNNLEDRKILERRTSKNHLRMVFSVILKKIISEHDANVVMNLNIAIKLRPNSKFTLKIKRFICETRKTVQMGFFSRSNKRAGWKISPKLINVQDGIRTCRMEFFKKLIRFAA